MAGDWIKIRTDLYEDQDVLQMSDILGTDDPTIVGLLVRFWSWADKQTIDGSGIKLTENRIDSLVGRPGFSAALREVGWLIGDDGNIQLPNFERHNGSSAKARALESEAKRLRRNNKKTSDKLSDKCPTKNTENVRPEKRREEKKEKDSLFPFALDGAGPDPAQKKEIHWNPNDGFSGISQEQIAKWQDAFPAVDIERQIKAASGWLEANPLKRKKNLQRFIYNWMSNKQEKGGDRIEIKQRQPMPPDETMDRVASWFGRPTGTLWLPEEVDAYEKARPTDKEIAGMEAYYTADIPEPQNMRRTTLTSLLNNWRSTELDRARAFYRKTCAA